MRYAEDYSPFSVFLIQFGFTFSPPPPPLILFSFFFYFHFYFVGKFSDAAETQSLDYHQYPTPRDLKYGILSFAWKAWQALVLMQQFMQLNLH